MSDIRKRTVDGLQKGATFVISRTFTEQEVDRFAHITRDYNPIHFDERYTDVKKFKARICHGLLVAGMVTEIGGQIGWLASGMSFVFKKPVYFGDTVTCSFAITDIDEKGRAQGFGTFHNQDGALVLEAVVTGSIPGSEEIHVLETMLSEGDPTNKLTNRAD